MSMGRYLQADLDAFDLRDLKCKFDVILLEPPLEEYYRESGIIASERFWTWDDVSGCFEEVDTFQLCVCMGITAS